MKRVLHVEDDIDILDVARMGLEISGHFEVRQCASGMEAVAAALEFGPDLLLLDLMMPGMDGETLLRELRKEPQLTGVPVVFMTARAQPQEIAALKALGADGVIVKPFDPMTLGDQLRAVLDARAERRQAG